MNYFLSSERLGFRTWTNEDLVLAEKLLGNQEVSKYIAAGGTFSKEQISELRKFKNLPDQIKNIIVSE